MLTLQEIKVVIDQLSPEDKAALQDYLAQERKTNQSVQAGKMNLDALLEAAQAIRDEMSQEDFDQMIEAMNTEYIEPLDKNE